MTRVASNGKLPRCTLTFFYGVVLEILYNMLKLCCFFGVVLIALCEGIMTMLFGTNSWWFLVRFWRSDLKSNVHPYTFLQNPGAIWCVLKKTVVSSGVVWLLWPLVWWAASSLDGWYFREISAPELTRVAPYDKSSIRWQQQHQMTRVAPDDKE